MKKSIIKIVYGILIFIIALLLSDLLINKGNTDMTMEMSDASMPLAYVGFGEQKINWLHGYRREMNPVYQNETITPVDATDRKMKLGVQLYGNTISQVHYEVRTVDGKRLIEDTDVMDYYAADDAVSIDLTLKDLYEYDKQYCFCLSLRLTDSTVAYYYTRIILCEEANHLGEYLAFVLDFHDKTFHKEEAQSITKYLESNSEGDNTTFSKVTIHSSFSQITWGDLEVKKEQQPYVTISQMNSNICRLKLAYIVSLSTEKEPQYYNVVEYYYVRLGKERMYLLDYERTMNSIFQSKADNYANNKIVLGISDQAIDIMESNDGNSFAFVKENCLYNFNLTSKKLALLFSFYDQKHTDKRDLYVNSRIRIISVDETGNTRFLVYGYMNRGNHEGTVGVACYYFNSMLNTIEEEIFIPSDISAQFLAQDVNQLSYVNNTNQLFLLLGGTIYKIDLVSKSYSVIADELSYGSYRVSRDNKMIVWQVGDDVNACEECIMLDLNTGKETRITAAKGEYIKALGFMNTDLVYGLANTFDVYENEFGRTVFPMYRVCIESEKGKILKNYEKTGVYVVDAQFNQNQIYLERMVKNEQGFVQTQSDQIMQDEQVDMNKNQIEVVPTQEYEKVVQIAAKSNIKAGSLKYLTPKQVMYEGIRELSLPLRQQPADAYYVYDKYGIAKVDYFAGEAVSKANELSGYVMNTKGQCIWEKSNRSTVRELSRIAPATSDETRGSLAVCLDTMLNYEGVAGDSQRLLESGKTSIAILEENLKNKQILDLSGCDLNSVLYYVDKNYPVLAILKDANAVLIVGYNELNTVLFNPLTGKIAKMGMNDSREFFAYNGNCFVTYFSPDSQ